MKHRSVCSVLLLLACGSHESTQSAGVSSPATNEAVGEPARLCANFDATSCPESCSRLFGAPYNATMQCLEAEFAVACADRTGGCDDAITFAKAPDGRVLRFRNACIPRGWSLIYLTSDVDRQCAEPTCASFDATGCPRPCSPLLGALYDADKQCLEAELAVACADATGGCDDTITLAKAPDGRILRFRNACIPQGWSVIYLTSDVNRQCAGP